MATAAEQLASSTRFSWKLIWKQVFVSFLGVIVYRILSHLPLPHLSELRAEISPEIDNTVIILLYNLITGNSLERVSLAAIWLLPFAATFITWQFIGHRQAPKQRSPIMRGLRYPYPKDLATFCIFAALFSILFSILCFCYLSELYILNALEISVTLFVGTLVVRMASDLIDKFGFGDGAFVFIFVGLSAEIIPNIDPWVEAQYLKFGDHGLLIGTAVTLCLIAIVVFLSRSQRRLLTQYPKRKVGEREVGGESSFLPIVPFRNAVNTIAAALVLTKLPTEVMSFQIGCIGPLFSDETVDPIKRILSGENNYFILILIAATLFVSATVYLTLNIESEESADSLKQRGGFLPGIRPGKRVFRSPESPRLTL